MAFSEEAEGVVVARIGWQKMSGFFYRHWLAQARSDPTDAFRQTQRDYIEGRAEGDWTPFILFGR
jgi:hypothetical protein